MRIKNAPAAAQPYPRYAACDSITNYGARGDGSADDAVALQRAINSVGSGCSIFFPPGVYRLDSEIVINKDITFQLGPQVEVRQLARVRADITAARSLTIQGEGPATSLWRAAIDFPFWYSRTGPKFRSIRLYNLEFKPYADSGAVQQYGGSTDLLEMVSVTISRNTSQSISFGFNGGESPPSEYPSLVVVRDVEVRGIRIDMYVVDADLEITRFVSSSPNLWQIRSTVGSGNRRFSISSSRLNFGHISGGTVTPAIELVAFGNGILSATINDVEITSQSWHAALNAQIGSGSPEITLLVNSLRFTTTFSASSGYAVRTVDSSTGIIRTVLSGCFFRTTVGRPHPAIERTLTNPNSLLTIAGVDQRGWASLT
jgi:hypothetical protein